jgi:Raf kinase inhibitor-like YbhB/YbcL family protein
MTAAMIPGCGRTSGRGKAAAAQSDSTGMMLTSGSFAAGDSIPRRYSLYGENISPDLNWDRVPEATRGFALVCRDPDAPGGTFYHWVLFNIPENVRSLPEGIGRDPVLPFGGIQGTNSFRRIGYDGPRPPSGTHRYYFDLYALDGVLPLGETATVGRLLDAMKGHVLAKASLMGKYKH